MRAIQAANDAGYPELSTMERRRFAALASCLVRGAGMPLPRLARVLRRDFDAMALNARRPSR